MTDIKKICDAMAALAAATRASYVTVSHHDDRFVVHLQHDEEADTRATAANLGIDLRRTGNESTEWLISDNLTLDSGVTVQVSGDHRDRQPTDIAKAISRDAIDSALALAEEAVRP